MKVDRSTIYSSLVLVTLTVSRPLVTNEPFRHLSKPNKYLRGDNESFETAKIRHINTINY